MTRRGIGREMAKGSESGVQGRSGTYLTSRRHGSLSSERSDVSNAVRFFPLRSARQFWWNRFYCAPPSARLFGRSDSTNEYGGHMIGPVFSGNFTEPDRKPSPIHSSISSVVAETNTGSQPIPSISSIRFFRSTMARTWSARAGSAGRPRKLARVAHASSRR